MITIPQVEPHQFPRRCAPIGSLQGQFTQRVDNFFVEELPAYLPTGEGEHLFVKVRKQGWTTRALLDHWTEVLSLRKGDIGYAGLKDRHATTIQWLSLPLISEDMLSALACEGVEILEAQRHRNKLRVGHLRGNRFEIRVAGLDPACLSMAQAMLDELVLRGVPNAYGSQRMGQRGDNRQTGRAVVLENKKVPRWKKKFLISAYQSALFNDILAFRMREGLLDTALAGDRMRKHSSGGLFLCTEPEVDQPRMDQLEISPTGPMFGYKMEQPEGQPAAWEAAVLEREQLSLEQFRACGKDAQGTRRLLRVPLLQPQCHFEQDHLILSFALPPGSYATVVLHELGISSSGM